MASLKTFAELDGDHYVVNGAKLWATEAHWMHCLVRTDRSGKPQTGISFPLIDMKTPGISIKPIVTIDGLHHTNATFFDNVRVPVANRVGAEGQGWGIAKFLLGNERVSIADTGPKLRLLREVRKHAAVCFADVTRSEAAKHLLRAKLADVSIQLLALCALERQCVENWAAGGKMGSPASTLKIRGSEILQAISELALELLGRLGNAYDPANLHRSTQDIGGPLQQASAMLYEYLYARCWSIFGGTNEVQRNLISRAVLGL
ncbi:MAG: acyl-CoA dehydrogenase family protein [Panacagrimonas sp.]